MVKTIRNIFLFLLLIILSTNSILAYNLTFNPTTPSYYLQDGNFSTDLDYNNFIYKTAITTELSDDNINTYFNLTLGDVCNRDDLKWYYQFNDFTSSEIHDSSSKNNDLIILPNSNIIQDLDYYGLEMSAISGSGANTPYTSEHNIDTEDFLIGIVIKNNIITTNEQHIMSRFDFLGSGYAIGLSNNVDSGSPFCSIKTNGKPLVKLLATGFNVSDNESHFISCARNNSNLSISVDGVYANSINSSNVLGNITTSANLMFGGIYISSLLGFNGIVDEAFLIEEICPLPIQEYIKTNKVRYNISDSNSIMIFYNHSIDINESYSLLVDISVLNSEDNIPFRIYTHQNMTHINESSYIEQSLSDGENYINLDDIIYEGYNYPFRMNFLIANGNSISEAVMFEVGNDTSPPIISDCQVSDSFIDCSDNITWKCKIEDDVAVSQAFGIVNINGVINITREVFNLGDGYWGVSFTNEELDILFVSLGWQFDSYANATLVYVNATDISNNVVENFTNTPSNIYGCLKCFEDWNQIDSACLITDTNFRYYTDLNNCSNTPFNIEVPIDNGTNVTCNYCSEDLQIVESLCTYQNTTYIKNVSYVDNLYPFCCGITGLVSDCSVDFYPYNETTQEFCTIFNNTMDCDSNTYTEFGFGSDKARWLCYPPVDVETETNCMSYVRDVHTGVIQTNPNYYTQGEAFISLDNEIEVRTSFEAVGNMVSVYFTKDNIIFDGREYVFGVRCTNEGDFYVYEQLITPEYENVNDPITRLVWIKSNVLGIVLGALLTTILIIGIAGYIRELRRRR